MKGILVIVIMTGSSLMACSQYAKPVYPQGQWEYHQDVDGLGWSMEKLSNLRRFIIDSANTTGVMVIYQGKILFEYGNVNDNSYMASCRKSILAMLYGPFVANGTIDLDRTLVQLDIDDIGGLLPRERQATVRHLLTARSGVYHPASNEGDQTGRAPKRGSVIPGQFFLYNNWDFNAAGYILENQTKKNIYDLVDSLFAKPLQMEDWKRSLQRKHGDSTKSKYLAYHLWFSTRDMARLGYLMLREGRWNELQLLPPSWVRQITSPVTTNEEALKAGTNYFDFSYGYLWWVWDSDYDKPAFRNGYSATGAFGQFITVLPALDLVVAHKTNYDDYRRSTSTELYLRMLEKLVSAKVR